MGNDATYFDAFLKAIRLLAVAVFTSVASVAFVSADEMRSDSVQVDRFWHGTKPQILTEKQFQDYLDLSEKLTETGGLEGIGNAATRAKQIAAIRQNTEFLSLLRERNYEPEVFYDTAVNVLLAFGVAGMAGQRAQIEETLAQLDESIGKNAYDTTKAEWQARLALMDQVPAGNIELANRFQNAFEAMSKRAP